MKYRRYAEYKDSGVEWLGEVPVHWEVKRLRMLAEVNPSKSEVATIPADTEVSFLPMESISELGDLDLSHNRPIEAVYQGFTYFRDNDVVTAKITPCFENGKGALAHGLTNGIAFGTTELHVLRAHAGTTPAFLWWVTRSQSFREFGALEMKGAAGQQRVPQSFIENFPQPTPPVDEQEAIVAFLDQETAQIDALIAKQERLVAVLQEKRQALISHAVTKGLNPEAPMKDSGVEWLGEVPAHWELTPIKHTLYEIIDTEHKTAPFYPEGDYLVVRTSNVKNGKLELEDAKYTDEAGYVEWTRRGKPDPGDILFTREAPAGEACIVPVDACLCLGQRMVLFKVNRKRLEPQFGVWSIYGGVGAEYIDNLSQGSTVVHFNMSDIGQIPVFLPPLEEQRTIVNVICRKLTDLDELAVKAELLISELQERRSALISAAVTGKIDVRGMSNEGSN